MTKVMYSIGQLTTCVKKLFEIIKGWRCETFEECGVVGLATVSQNGTIANGSKLNGASITRTGVGTYTITAPPGAITALPQVVEPEGSNDDISIYLHSSFTGLTLTIAEQDNGGNPGVPRDRPWTIVWFGTISKTRVVCDP